MLVTTTPNVEGKRITKYLGIVTGEAILGANVFKDVFAGIRDIVGGRSATYERELKRARDLAITGQADRGAPGAALRPGGISFVLLIGSDRSSAAQGHQLPPLEQQAGRDPMQPCDGRYRHARLHRLLDQL